MVVDLDLLYLYLASVWTSASALTSTLDFNISFFKLGGQNFAWQQIQTSSTYIQPQFGPQPQPQPQPQPRPRRSIFHFSSQEAEILHGTRSKPPLPISSLSFDLDLSLGLRGQHFIFQARRPKFFKVIDIDSNNRLYIPYHTIPYYS